MGLEQMSDGIKLEGRIRVSYNYPIHSKFYLIILVEAFLINFSNHVRWFLNKNIRYINSNMPIRPSSK